MNTVSVEILFSAFFILSWVICVQGQSIKNRLNNMPILNKESVCLHVAFSVSFLAWIAEALWVDINLLPWTLMIGMVTFFWSAEPHNECFWRKNRNVFSAVIVLGFLNLASMFAGLHDSIPAVGYLYLFLKKSQSNLGVYFEMQNRDFKGLRQKLAMIKSRNHNDSIRIDGETDYPAQDLDKAV
ncbi:hypothetical protein N9D31_00575 [Oligoflexaceae bacterium]|nr:hypothetical protein [Oligoflexaceae bacterium]